MERRKHENIEWTMKDGKTIRLSEMTDSHIRNCIAMLHRRIEQIDDRERYERFQYNPFDPDTEAYWACESELNGFDDPEEFYQSQIEIFEAELAYREKNGLLVDTRVSTKLIDKWKKK